MQLAEPGIEILAVQKGSETYIVLWDDRTPTSTVTHHVGRWAADPSLSFTWYDAAIACQAVSRRQDGNCSGR
jgi:hypothetical protein